MDKRGFLRILLGLIIATVLPVRFFLKGRNFLINESKLKMDEKLLG